MLAFTAYIVYNDLHNVQRASRIVIKAIPTVLSIWLVFQLYTFKMEAKISALDDTRVMNLVFLHQNVRNMNMLFGNGYNYDIDTDTLDMSFKHSNRIMRHFRDGRFTSFFVKGFYQAGLLYLVLLSLLYWLGYRYRVLPYLTILSIAYFFHGKDMLLLSSIPLFSITFASISKTRNMPNRVVNALYVRNEPTPLGSTSTAEAM